MVAYIDSPNYFFRAENSAESPAALQALIDVEGDWKLDDVGRWVWAHDVR
jgi:hypothetical protein